MPMSPSKQLLYQRERRRKMLAKGVCVYCGRYRPKQGYKVCGRCRRKFKDRLREMKEYVLREYGGKCVCCGEGTYEFLSFDHKRNDGAAERRRLKAARCGFALLRLIIKQKFPKCYQVLCHNCNLAKGFFGKCPHGNL